MLVGDWARKYERMGEDEGEGILTCGGVCRFEELAESDDADETETERRLLRLTMGMGSEGFVDCSFEDI